MEDSSGPAATPGGGRSAERRRRLVPALIDFGVAAILGRVVGGLIVRATWGPADGGGNDGGAAEVTGSSGSTAACPPASAAHVAAKTLPSVVTVSASNAVLTRSAAIAIGIGIGSLLVVESLITIVASGASSYLPGGTLDALANGGNDQLSWGASLGLVVLYDLIAAGVAFGVFRTRDIVA